MRGARIGQGLTAEVFEYGDGCVLKLYRDWVHASSIGFEYEASSIAYGCGLPTPRPCGRLDEEGRSGIVFERANGPTMLDGIRSKPWRLFDYARTFADLHADMHRIEASGLPDRKESFAHDIRRVDRLSDDEKEAVLAVLARLPGGTKLCHGDFHPDNIVLGGGGPQVIDWMTAGRGDPASDVARVTVLLRFAALPEHIPPRGRLAIELARAGLLARYRSRYKARTGLTDGDIDSWMVPAAAARLNERLSEREKDRLAGFVREGLAASTRKRRGRT
ncbi:phosphotransferase family protein [Paenibacillus flagellatus]|uniref:Aminoglycoside phosphotransferase domain-containing protein n=1 Tax=Paenibacillus flagellatus TaxID=2211139 RepID=A0A2V5K6T3_9BACL|nr:phosphotransferase [Paenibacillus flagellatus]PYI55111.1 hypothetical protein DLM86_11320 [Paenibacillus flagellatus]